VHIQSLTIWLWGEQYTTLTSDAHIRGLNEVDWFEVSNNSIGNNEQFAVRDSRKSDCPQNIRNLSRKLSLRPRINIGRATAISNVLEMCSFLTCSLDGPSFGRCPAGNLHLDTCDWGLANVSPAQVRHSGIEESISFSYKLAQRCVMADPRQRGCKTSAPGCPIC
jgi:hypothetical protein